MEKDTQKKPQTPQSLDAWQSSKAFYFPSLFHPEKKSIL